jgi:hypothetical protein
VDQVLVGILDRLELPVSLDKQEQLQHQDIVGKLAAMEFLVIQAKKVV